MMIEVVLLSAVMVFAVVLARHTHSLRHCVSPFEEAEDAFTEAEIHETAA